MEQNQDWNSQLSEDLFLIQKWGLGYFGANQKGNLCIYPSRHRSGPEIDIHEVIAEMKNKKINFPAVIRFHDILRSQVKSINKLFDFMISEANYQGKYFGVYPIKVNQMREVVEEVVDEGQHYDYGLEAGSKAELIAVLSQDISPNSLIVCNGYKDRDFMRLALLGRKIKGNVIVVVEKFSELSLLLETAEELDIDPLIGLRGKLQSKSCGKWANSSGDKAKFGLSSLELVKSVELLKAKNKLHLLKLFHFHMGSQIPDIRTMKSAITEGARLYCELVKLGAPLDYFDVGGGVGIDYDGTHSNSISSINYYFKDYVGDVVYLLKDICDEEGVRHPHIVSESGRAMTAHHSCVITNVFGQINVAENDSPFEVTGDEHSLVLKMKGLYNDMDDENFQEAYQDAVQIKEEIQSAFSLGVLSLKERTLGETLFWKVARSVQTKLKKKTDNTEDLEQINELLSRKYLCNLSIFQSAPDSWAIDQVLPVLPLQRLNEKPTVECQLADITCDSDGQISRFVAQGGHKKYMMAHELDKREYFIGLFLTGAYQDVMGDNHNLFGRLNEVHVYMDDDDPNDFYIEEVISGSTSADILKMMQYDPKELARTIKKSIDKKVKDGEIKPRTGVELTDFYEACLNQYTYLS